MNNYNYHYEAKTLELSEDIEKQFERYGVNIKIINCLARKDRVIFDVKLKGATREAQLFARASDVQSKLKLPLFHPFKHDFTLFIAVSDLKIKHKSLPEILVSSAYTEAKKKLKLPYVVGHNFLGDLVIADLAAENHLLIGGSSGSGKSVALQCLITSLITSKSAARVNLLLIDVGANDLMPFEGIPQLSCPVIRDTETGLSALRALKIELDRRIDIEISNNDEFNLLPRIVCVIDEFPALISGIGDKQTAKSLIGTISSLLQRGRHAKIHLVLAAQNPTMQNMKVDLGNITTRIALTCAKPNFSETILGERGAENLLGKGDMYFKSPQYDGIQRVQGAFISPRELKQKLLYLKMKPFPNHRSEHMFLISEIDLQQTESEINNGLTNKAVITKQDIDNKLFAQLILWALEHESISGNMICDTFHLGWKRANGFLEKLRELGIAGDIYAKLPRAVLPQDIEDISVETIEFLSKSGISTDEIATAIQNRNRVQCGMHHS